MKTHIGQVNDVVVFAFKGEPIQGTILRFRTRRSRKLDRMAQQFGLHGPLETDQEVAEIATIGRGIYTVNVAHIIRVLEADPVRVQKEKEFAANMVVHNLQVKTERKDANFECAEKHGLINIHAPTLVWVRYKGNYVKQETALGLSPSWQIKIKTINGSRFLPPQCVYMNRDEMSRS